VPEALEQQARDSAPELAGVDTSTLLRAGLAVLAGHHDVGDAVRVALDARMPRGGPRIRGQLLA
jgi:hypothetical protein